MSMLTKDELIELIKNNTEEFNEYIRNFQEEIDLSECDFSYLTISNADFTGCNLNDSTFVETELKNINFNESDLTGANFNRANLLECDFADSILNGAEFSYAKVDYCNFADADMAGVVFTSANLENSDFAASINLNACRFDEDTIWPDSDLLPDDFDISYINDLSSLRDEDDETSNDIY